MTALPHIELQILKSRLQQIHNAISNFQPLTARPPILDSSYDAANETNEENQWLKQENIPGLKKLRDNIKIDLGVLEKFLDDPACSNLPPLSTNAPYLIAVWNEVLCAPALVVSVFKTFLFDPPANHAPADGSRKRSTQRPPGAKVDVVADSGRHWIRVNTVKNSRMLSEFREIDSYLTESEGESGEDSEDVGRPTLAQTEFDNSVLSMGRSLLEAARANPIEGTGEIPKVTLRLTRLDPNLSNDGVEPDARIAQTISLLREMGLVIELGERDEASLPTVTPQIETSEPPATYVPTTNINLDLSVLIALISDLTHASVPTTIAEANRRFLPPQEYREWKKQKQILSPKPPRKPSSKPRPPKPEPSGVEADINDLPHDLIKHSRALTNQLLQEMGKGLIQELHDRLSPLHSGEDMAGSAASKVVFWTTHEARDRCLRIVSKIGGVHEKRRARALFCLDAADASVLIPVDEAERLYWQDSRFAPTFVPILPIHLFPITPAAGPTPSLIASFSTSVSKTSSLRKTPFNRSLGRTCTYILSQETISHPRALPDHFLNNVNPRLTAHTVQSMQWGAQLGWTTLTANRTSVKAILREMKAAKLAGRLIGVELDDVDDIQDEDMETKDAETSAAIWIIDPRSLAEGFFGDIIHDAVIMGRLFASINLKK
ncbi:hypothetical protein B0H34DRAFT_97427 [Crassisporium funariophilum]|nr:hypothetical protein B0H34DRAFT_97427 [Crassisporium funariophilum]